MANGRSEQKWRARGWKSGCVPGRKRRRQLVGQRPPYSHLQPRRPRPLPHHPLLKLVDTNTGDGEFFLPSEVTYYTRDYVDLPDTPLVRCYDGAYSAAQNRYHLPLDDLSETHEAAYDLQPSLEHGQALAEALAILHVHWWGAERLQHSPLLAKQPAPRIRTSCFAPLSSNPGGAWCARLCLGAALR